MPIRPDQRRLYPFDWRELSKSVRFRRAAGLCEHCRRPHGQRLRVAPGGLWWDAGVEGWRDAHGRRIRGLPSPLRLAARQYRLPGFPPPSPRTSLTVLATAHLDHDAANNNSRNLAALCQRCHLAHDRVEHRRQRWTTLYRRRALGDLLALPFSTLGDENRP